MLLSQPALLALAAKYEALIKLRRARDADANASVSATTRAELRDLSATFPGCLRELDRCTLPVLMQRLADVNDARNDLQAAPWIAWMWRYHELLRIALEVKSGHTLHPPALAAFVAACLAPPAGKVVPLVFEQLEREAHAPAFVIRDTLFPVRHR